MLDLSNILKFKNKKGQAFSTFQLLIAAVVALALLGVLMPIIMKTLGFAQGDPISTSKQLLQSQIDNPGTLSYTDSVAFTSSKNSLAASGISENTGVTREQIMLLSNDLTEFKANPDGEPGNVLSYQKTTKGTYKIGVLCDYSDSIEGAINNYSTEIPNISAAGITETSFPEAAGQKVCIVFPMRSS